MRRPPTAFLFLSAPRRRRPASGIECMRAAAVLLGAVASGSLTHLRLQPNAAAVLLGAVASGSLTHRRLQPNSTQLRGRPHGQRSASRAAVVRELNERFGGGRPSADARDAGVFVSVWWERFSYVGHLWEFYEEHFYSAAKWYQNGSSPDRLLRHMSGSIINARVPWASSDLANGGWIIRPEFVESAMQCAYAQDAATAHRNLTLRGCPRWRRGAARAGAGGPPPSVPASTFARAARTSEPHHESLQSMLQAQEARLAKAGPKWRRRFCPAECYNEVVCATQGPKGWYAQLPGAVMAVAIRREGARARKGQKPLLALGKAKELWYARDARDAFVRHFGLELEDVPLLYYDYGGDPGAPFSLVNARTERREVKVYADPNNPFQSIRRIGPPRNGTADWVKRFGR